MATTFIDPPGPLTNTSEVIEFTTDRVVTSISVEYRPTFGNGLRETVWDGTSDVDNSGGDFSWTYRASSRSGSGPYSWRIVREGVWPAAFRIRIHEEPLVNVNSLWTKFYELDLTALPTQTLVAGSGLDYRTFTLGGQPWYAHWGNADGANFRVVNGLGLEMFCSGDSYSGNPYAGMHAGLLAYQMAGYNAAKEYAVVVHFKGDMLTNISGNHAKFGASWWSGPEGWGYGPGNNNLIATCGYDGIQYGHAGSSQGSGGIFQIQTAPSNEQMENISLSVRRRPFTNDLELVKSARYNMRTGGFARDLGRTAVPDDMLGLGSANGVGASEAANDKFGFYAGRQNGGFSNFFIYAAYIALYSKSVP